MPTATAWHGPQGGVVDLRGVLVQKGFLPRRPAACTIFHLVVPTPEHYIETLKSLHSQIPRETPMLRSGVWTPMAETSVENNI